MNRLLVHTVWLTRPRQQDAPSETYEPPSTHTALVLPATTARHTDGTLSVFRATSLKFLGFLLPLYLHTSAEFGKRKKRGGGGLKREGGGDLIKQIL